MQQGIFLLSIVPAAPGLAQEAGAPSDFCAVFNRVYSEGNRKFRPFETQFNLGDTEFPKVVSKAWFPNASICTIETVYNTTFQCTWQYEIGDADAAVKDSADLVGAIATCVSGTNLRFSRPHWEGQEAYLALQQARSHLAHSDIQVSVRKETRLRGPTLVLKLEYLK